MREIKFISLEPLLDWKHILPDSPNWWLEHYGINWLITGACTGSKAEIMELHKKYPELTPMLWYKNRWILAPEVGWIREIVQAADKAGVPVFLKENLQPLLLPGDGVLFDGNFYTRDPKVCAECEAGDPCHACGAGVQLRQEFPK